jgi:hypothetical protein
VIEFGNREVRPVLKGVRLFVPNKPEESKPIDTSLFKIPFIKTILSPDKTSIEAAPRAGPGPPPS